MVNSNVSISEDALTSVCGRYGVAKLSLFGSVLRDDFHDDSDVDMLVEFTPEASPTYFKMMQMEEELSALIGRSVDLRTPLELSQYIRQRVIDEAEVRYVRR